MFEEKTFTPSRSPRRSRACAHVPNDKHFPRVYGHRNVRLGTHVKAQSQRPKPEQEQALAILDFVGLNDAIHEPATALSSAPQRLLMIATALTAQLDTRLNSLSSAPARSFIERAARSIESRQPLLGSKNARRSLPSPAHSIASRGRSSRALISKFCSSSTCWMQHQRSSFAIPQQLLGRLQPQPLRDLGAETDMEVGLADPVADVLGVPEVDCAIDCVGFEAKAQGADGKVVEAPARPSNSGARQLSRKQRNVHPRKNGFRIRTWSSLDQAIMAHRDLRERRGGRTLK
jgi:hypothetical protein